MNNCIFEKRKQRPKYVNILESLYDRPFTCLPLCASVIEKGKKKKKKKKKKKRNYFREEQCFETKLKCSI